MQPNPSPPPGSEQLNKGQKTRSAGAPAVGRRWLLPVRAGWLLFATVCAALFVLGTVNTARQPLMRCTAPGSACSASNLVSLEDVETAAEMGLPTGFLAPASLAFSLAARLSLAAVGLLIFWRRSDDWVALVISGGLMSVLLEGIQGIGEVLVAVQEVMSGIGTALFLPIPFIFPSGRFEPPWVRLSAIILTVLYVIFVVNRGRGDLCRRRCCVDPGLAAGSAGGPLLLAPLKSSGSSPAAGWRAPASPEARRTASAVRVT